MLSLFDGISCGRVAIERAGIPVKQYDAYEIESNAIKVSEYNYPEINHKGDVFDAVYSEGEYDLLIGGSPCTYWSISRVGGGEKRNGIKRETTASGLGWDLFSQYIRALNEVKPKWFLYENNFSMADEIRDCITEQLGVEPIMIDSADFSAQKRKRYYWTNIPILDYIKDETVFADIQSDTYTLSRNLEPWKDTIKYSKDGMAIKWDTSGKGYYSQANRAKLPNQKWDTVCASRAEDKGKIWLGDMMVRSITMLELERLQTLPDNYTACLKNKEMRGRCIGNGWTVNVIAHILKGIKES